MADAVTVITLESLHEAIESGLAAAFPAFRTVEFYRDDQDERIPTPALLLEMSEAEPTLETDAGTGQLPVALRFEARVIIQRRSKADRFEVRKAATAVATWLHNRRWPGVATDPCVVIACERDELDPHGDHFEVWRVEWVQPAMLGASAWEPGEPMGEAWYSFAPLVGIPHEHEYRPVSP